MLANDMGRIVWFCGCVKHVMNTIPTVVTHENLDVGIRHNFHPS